MAEREEMTDSDRQPFLNDLANRRVEFERDPNFHQFLDDLCRISQLSRDEAEQASTSVLCLLDQHLRSGSARLPDAHIPDSVEKLLLACERPGEQPALVFDRDEFLATIADDLQCDEAVAEQRASQVFEALRRQMSHEEIVHFGRMLPARIQNIFF